MFPKWDPPFVRNNPKGPYLHEKLFYAIVTNPLSKSMNRGGEEGMGVGHFLVRYQKERENLKNERELTRES